MSTTSFELPPLYFASRGQTLTTTSEQENSDNTSEEAAVAVAAVVSLLPAELLHQCLAGYADYGDLAKLATVQREWSSVLADAVASSAAHQWELACALLDGRRGLQVDVRRAVTLLRELAVLANNSDDGEEQQQRVAIDAATLAPVYDKEQQQQPEPQADNNNNSGDDNNNEYAPMAMKKLAFLFLDGTMEKIAAAASADNDNSGTDHKNIGLQWLECAFRVGRDADAAHEMALIREYGRYGVAADPSVAFAWFETAARAGHIEGMAELALCYELGCGCDPDDEQALDWYVRAAEAGHVTAKFSVGECFEEARGVPQSDTEACLWYYKAAVAGCDDSRRALKRLEDIARIVVPGVRALLLDE